MPFRYLHRLWRNIFDQRRVDQDLELELRGYLDLVAAEKARLGMSREEAFDQARRELGGMEQVKESVRDVRVGVSMDHLFQDMRYGLRVLRRNPGFAAAAILTLSLGIGATTAIFSVVDAVMLKPLPFPSASRLMRIQSMIAASGHGSVASYPDFLDWRARNHVFDSMAVFRTDAFTMIGSGEPQHLEGAVVSAELFHLLGIQPALGRGFLPEEDVPAAAGGADAVILSSGLWQRQFASDQNVVGRKIQLGGQPFVVIGVMPAGFQFPIQGEQIELWTTIAGDARGGANAMTVQRGAHYLDVIGLLRPGITMSRAQAELSAITRSLNHEHPENKPRAVRIVPEIQGLIGPLRTPLLVLLGAVGCVLFIACVNVANLLLARATGRRAEMAVRAALGASRGRVVCQLLTESVALSLLGGALGLALAMASLRLLVRFIPAQVPRLGEIGLDLRLLSFTVAISMLAGILFGLAPALGVSKISLTDSLKKGGRGSGSLANERGRLRDALVVSEVAFAIVLLVGAGLLIQSFLHLTQVQPGFDSHRVLTFQLDAPPGKQYLQSPAFFRDIVASVATLPGAVSASAVGALPLTGDNVGVSLEVEGQPTPLGSRPSVDFNVVEPNYLHTMRIALVEGRDFTGRDDLKSTAVAIVNRTLAERYFPGQDPIGKHIRPGIGNGYPPGEEPMREIVGVIADVRQRGLGAEAAPEVFAPLAQCPFDNMVIVVRTQNEPLGLAEAARRRVVSADKNAPIYHVTTLDEYLAQSVATPRLVTVLLSGFSGFALLLASLGVYGVISYLVLQRTHEIGIRMALGASKGDVLGMILHDGLRPALVGVAIGIASALRLTQLLASLLYDVKPTDWLTFIGVPVILAAAALVACYIPARRAARADPMLSLRYE